MVFNSYSTEVFIAHLIRFISFVIAFYLHPTVTKWIAENVAYEWAQFLLPFIITYLGAMYIFPKIGSMLANSMRRY